MDMRKILLLYLIIISCGCKKETVVSPDYDCNCQPFGKNLSSLYFNHASSFYPFKTEKLRWGYLDSKGDTLIPPQYAGTYMFSNHRGMVIYDKEGVQLAGFIDETGAFAIQPHYRYLIDAFFSDEGLIPMGDKITYLIGYIDKNGTERVPFKYDNGLNYHEGVAIVLLGNYVGAIDINGNVIVPIQYNSLGIFSEGLAFAMEYGGGKAGYIDTTGEFKFRGDYSLGSVFMYGRAAVKVGDKFGFIDNMGNLVIPANYTNAGIFSENVAAVQYDGKWGFINVSGSWVITPRFDNVGGGFCNGLVPVEKNGQWGYIDSSGSLVIPYQFDDAGLFYCDLAKVWFIDATTGYINKTGKIIYHSKSSLKDRDERQMNPDHFKKFAIFASKE
jgi:hypothetical protein